MYKDIEEKLAKEKGDKYDGFINGLPVGLVLPNGVTIGA
jgi:salicylate hydroxylase